MKIDNELSLLEQGLNSLESQKENKRDKIFKNNQDAISLITKSNAVSTRVDSLRIRPNINGSTDKQPDQPLVKGNYIKIDLGKITLPGKLGGGTLKDTIKKLCNSCDIEFDSSDSIGSAIFTPVVTAIAGQHAEDDENCEGVTKAEFVPVFTIDDTSRVLAISFSSNGETGLRTDLMKVSGSMACLDRLNKNSTSMQAIEIPNDIAMKLSKENTELFKKLQENSCMVVFVEFDLEQKKYNYESLTRGGGTRGGDIGYKEKSVSKGISAYSVIGKGSSTEDNSTSISESGTRKLKKITVYNVGALVINTNGQELNSEQTDIISKMMKMRVEELNSQFDKFKVQDFASLSFEVNTFLKSFDVNTGNSDVFEHTMLKLAEITEQPTECKTDKSTKTPENFFMDFGLSLKSIKLLEFNLRKKFGDNFSKFTPEFNRNNSYAMRFSISEVMENMGVIQECMNDTLSNPRDLFAYQQYSHGNSYFAESVFSKLSNLSKEVGLSANKSDCIEMILLKMFDCDEELVAARFESGKDYVGKITDIHFYLSISEDAAKNLIKEIDKYFSNNSIKYNLSRFIRSDARIEDKGDIDLCDIVLDTRLLLSEEFQNLFKTTLNNLVENEPLFIEKLRIQSGTQDKSSEQYAKDLSNIVDHIINTSEIEQTEDKTKAKQGLTESIKFFSKVLCTPKCNNSERLKASYDVKRRISLYEFFQEKDENKKFKDGDKKDIKKVQKSLKLV